MQKVGGDYYTSLSDKALKATLLNVTYAIRKESDETNK